MKRCDHLPLLDANPGKIRALLDVLAAFRGAAPDVAADQWRRFFEQGRFRKMVSAAEEARAARLARAKDAVGAVRLQMLRFQVVGQIESFMANRGNEFRDLVFASSLDEATRHQRLTINRMGGWSGTIPVTSGGAGQSTIPGTMCRSCFANPGRCAMAHRSRAGFCPAP